MEKLDKILVYIEQSGKKHILVYENEKSLLALLHPEQMIDNGTVKNTANIVERWEINKVTKSKNKMTMEFKLLLRKNQPEL